MEMAERRQRLWLDFGVDGDLRWLGHLDLFRTWERTLRRTGLPLLYSQGYNPRPRMAIALPLPVGLTSEAERLDLLLATPVSLTEFMHCVRDQLPGGLSVRSLEEVDLGMASLQSELQSADYVICLAGGCGALRQRVEELMAAESCLRQRRGRAYDLRPLVLSLSSRGSEKLRMTLRAGEAGTGRPDEVLLALGLSPQKAAIHRQRLRFAFDK
jgi:radical SAM-linked protein